MRKFFGGTRKADFYFFNKPPPTPSTLPVFTPFLLNQPIVTFLLCRSSYNFIYCTEIFFVYKLPHFSNQIYGFRHKKQYNTKYGDIDTKKQYNLNANRRNHGQTKIMLLYLNQRRLHQRRHSWASSPPALHSLLLLPPSLTSMTSASATL